MRILKILNQHRRDFTATMTCEHCDAQSELSTGYDDAYYHDEVIPNMECPSCGEKGKNYVPLKPKYPEGMQI